MRKNSSIRRFAASALLAAGLAYPACAAVCPKGIGGCPSPGRCFLFVDADANSLCDYTGRTGSQAAGGFPTRPDAPGSSINPVQTTAATVTDPSVSASAGQASSAAAPVQTISTPVAVPGTNATTPALQGTSSGGVLDTIHLSAPVAEIILFLILTGAFYTLIRTGAFGMQQQKRRPALALAAFFGLGTSLILTCLLAGSSLTSGTTYALLYMGAGTLLAAYLWREGVMTRKIVLSATLTGTLAGFVFLAPIMPTELGGVVNVLTGVSALTAGVLVILLVIAMAFAVGRVFCGNICPVGAIQELVYTLPVKKIIIRRTELLELIRLGVFVATVIAAVYLIDLLAVTGLYDLFSLTVSGGLLVAAGILIVSAFLYRPVCRILCPFGVLFSIFAEFSLLRLHRTENCINCKKCQRACPARIAGQDDPKRECYLCGRCTRVCPVKTALAYC